MPLSPPLCLQAFFSPGSSSGNDYTATMSITPQFYMANGTTNSSYNGTHVAAGMYATSNFNGQIFRIKSITSQSSSSVTAVLEDIGGINKTIDTSGGISGGGPVSGTGYIFEINSDGLPALTAVNNAPTITFPDSILGRFIYDKPSTLTETYAVAVGQGGSTIATSADGINWVSRTSRMETAGRGISWNGSTWVATGQGTSTIVTSSDGINWTERTLSLFVTINTVEYNGSYWLAGGTKTGGAIIAISTDGLTWAEVLPCPFTTSCNALAWNGSLWVAGGEGTNTVATSSDGVSWTARSAPITSVCYAVAWSGTTWVVGGGNGVGTRIMTSTNGITWTSRTITGLTICYTVASNGFYLLAGGQRSGTSAISISNDNGVTWTAVTHPTTITICYSLRWNGFDTWLAGGNSSTLITSSNGTSWLSTSLSPLTTCRVVEWTGGSWLVGGQGGPFMITSTNNGGTWTSVANPFLSRINAIRVSATAVIAGGSGDTTNTAIATSFNVTTFNSTTTWVFNPIIFTTAGYTAASNGVIWVVGGEGGSRLATSPNGVTWTTRATPFTTRVNEIAWNGFIWVAGGEGTATLATSTDGITWISRTSSFTTACHSIAWNGSYWVAGGQGTNTIATSLDGVTWTARTSPFTTACFAVAWNGSIWVAGGQGTAILATSTDGITWTQRTSPFTTACYAVTWNGSIWIAGGQGTATIATSVDGITWIARSNPFTTAVRHISTRRTLPFVPIQFPGNTQQLNIAHVGTATGPSIYQSSSPNTGIYFPSTNTIGISTSGLERMRLTASGSVGIGTSSPQALLDVNGGIQLLGLTNNNIARPALASGQTVPDYELRAKTVNGDDGFMRMRAGGTANTNTSSFIDLCGFSSITDMTRTVVFGTSGNERMRINTSGNVGIGTTDPRCKLQIVDTYGTPTGPSNTTPSASTHLSVLDTVTQNSNVEAVLMEIGAQNRSVGSATADVIYKYQAGFQNTNDTRGGNFVINAVPSNNPYTSDGLTLNRFNITTLGNVGIGGLPGASGPQGRLHVYSPTNPGDHGSLCLENGQTFAFNTGANIGTNIAFKSNWAGDVTNPAIMGRIDVLKENSANYGDSYIAFSNRYTTDRNAGGVGVLSEQMRITGIGNVGIGRTVPTQRLDVAGIIRGIGNIINTTTYSSSINSWSTISGSNQAILGTTDFKPNLKQSGTVQLIINASVELGFNSGSGFDHLAWVVNVNNVACAQYRINYNNNNVEGRALDANNFGAGTVVVSVTPNAFSSLPVLLVVSRGGDDVLYYRNAYLVVHELSNAT